MLLRLFLISTALFFHSAFASGPATSGSSAIDAEPTSQEGPHSWKDPAYETCGFSCLYEKANENIGLQIKYAVEKILALNEATPEQRMKALGSFCLQGEESDACLKRYLKIQVYNLRKMHAAMVKNYASRTAVSNRKNSTEFYRSPLREVVSENDPKKKRQTPYVVTYEDLKKEFQEMRNLGSNDYQRWAEHLPSEPSPEDFAIFEEKLKDPSDPKSDHFLVVAHDADGKVKYDKKAYEAALKRYHEKIEGELSRMGKEKSVPTKSSQDLDEVAGEVNQKAFKEAQKFKIETWVPAGGKPTVQSQSSIDFSSKPAEPSKRETKEMSINELKKQGITGLYISPKEIGKVIDLLEQTISALDN